MLYHLGNEAAAKVLTKLEYAFLLHFVDIGQMYFETAHWNILVFKNILMVG